MPFLWHILFIMLKSIINPRRACAARVTVVVLCVCMCVCVYVCMYRVSFRKLDKGGQNHSYEKNGGAKECARQRAC